MVFMMEYGGLDVGGINGSGRMAETDPLEGRAGLSAHCPGLPPEAANGRMAPPDRRARRPGLASGHFQPWVWRQLRLGTQPVLEIVSVAPAIDLKKGIGQPGDFVVLRLGWDQIGA